MGPLWAAMAWGAPSLEPTTGAATGSSRVIGLAGANGALPTDPTGGWRNPASAVGGWSSSRVPATPPDVFEATFRLTGWMGVLLRQLGPPGVDDPGIRTTQGLHLLQAMHAGLGLHHEGWTVSVLLRTRSLLHDAGIPDDLRRRADTSDSSVVIGRSGRVAWAAGPVLRVDRLCGLSDFAAEPVVCGPRRALALGLGVHGGLRAAVVPDRLSVGLAVDAGSARLGGTGDVGFVRPVSAEVSAALALTPAGLRPGEGAGRAVQVLAAVRGGAGTAGCALPDLDDVSPACRASTVPTVQPSVALETEPIDRILRTRTGVYVEPSRAGEGARTHVTAGADVWIGAIPGPFTGLTLAADYGWPTARVEGHYVHGVISPTVLW